MGVEDVQKLNNIVGIDLFLSIYAVAAKNRKEEDDVDFMVQLRTALVAFKKRKAEAKAVASLAFENEAGPSHQVEKGEKGEKKQKGKAKVRPFT
jgi:hypothetical protein